MTRRLQSQGTANKVSRLTTIVLLAGYLLVVACGRVTLSLTDAPVDLADSVVLVFTGVEFHPDEGDIVEVDFKPARAIDLMGLKNGVAEILLDEESLPKGKFIRVRLLVDQDESYITQNGEQYPLTIPTDAAEGLLVERSFDIRTGAESRFTIDFDLRKSLYEPASGEQTYRLRPVLRMVDNTEVGSVSGTVDASFLGTEPDCYSGNGAVTAVVYVFRGKDISPDDIDGNDAEPLSSARVTAGLVYTAAFLEEDEYTLALTCQAGSDSPSDDDDIRFLRSVTVKINKTATSILNFGF